MLSSTSWIEADASSRLTLADNATDETVHFTEIGEIRENAAGVVNEEPCRDRVSHDRPTICSQSGELAFMAPRDEAECGRHRFIGVPQTVGRQRSEQTLLTAVDRCQGSVRKMPVAVVDCIPAAVGGDDERIIPVSMEKRRQCVRFVVIVKVTVRVVSETACAPKFRNLENILRTRCGIAQKFWRHVASSLFLDIFTILLTYPTRAADIAIEFCRKLAPAGAYDIDVLARCSGDRQHFVDAKVGMLAPVPLVARQPLKLYCRA